MRIHHPLSIALTALTLSTHAQKGDLSVGLNTFYFPSGFAGLGASVDYRWHLGQRTELIGLLSNTHFFEVGLGEDRRRNHNSVDDLWNRSIQAGGIGFGYRFGKDGRGFHLGLLAGGAAYEGVDLDNKTRRLLSPALGLTMGHRIGKRFDVSLDGWVVRTVKDELAPLPLLRFSYSLGRKK